MFIWTISWFPCAASDDSPPSRMDHKSGEVWTDTQTRVRFHGVEIQNAGFHGSSPAENASQDSVHNRSLSSGSIDIAAGYAHNARNNSVRHHWFQEGGYVSVQFNGGPAKFGIKPPGIGTSKSKCQAGSFIIWPGGHLRRLCRDCHSSSERQNSPCSQTRLLMEWGGGDASTHGWGGGGGGGGGSGGHKSLFIHWNPWYSWHFTEPHFKMDCWGGEISLFDPWPSSSRDGYCSWTEGYVVIMGI